MERDEEEFYPDEGLPDVNEEFEGCYTIIRDDFSQLNLFNVTIKGDAPEGGINLCRYTVVYTDGSVKRIAWQPNDLIWTELGAGYTAHSLSVGALIENQFGSNALPRTDFGVFKPTGFDATQPFDAWYAIDDVIFNISIVSSEDSDGEGLYLVYYLSEKRNNEQADRIIFFNPDIFGWDEKINEPSLHTWLVGDIITAAYT